MKRVLSPGWTADGQVYVTVEYGPSAHGGDPRLSLTGIEGPLSNGNCTGSCGQIVESLGRLTRLAPGWTEETVSQLRDVWTRWHLNDMRAGCSHQRAAGWGVDRLSEPCPECGYGYGTAWLSEPVPAEVLAFLGSLPMADGLPAKWRHA